MLAIEIDGTSHNSTEAQVKDQTRQKRLESLGITMLRFAESDMRNDMGSVLEAIEECVFEKKREVTPP